MPQTPQVAEESAYRRRLMEGMARALAANGYADTTITHIVREAAVSRRTFYEHFATKAECLIALYEAASLNALKTLREAIDPERDWQVQIENA
ncbi:MAG TPA: helix-turn-helix domain-containing protein, partial [Burkholderiaceae bacterium]|nr:helix-turn-helix domain-containing protein [Burkholderiaceae bacterium]